MKKRLPLLLLLPCLLSGFTPIGGAPDPGGAAPPGAPEKTVHDDIGRRVRVPLHPRRIVSLAPSVTETLFALGAGDALVGVTDFCDYPAAARSKARIGGMVNPSWEAVLQLHPDLIVATTSGNDRGVVARAEALQLPLYFLDSPDIHSLLESFLSLGELLDSPASARVLHDSLTARLDQLERQVSRGPRPRVLFLVWGEPIVVPGRGTFLTDALLRSGCDSVTSDGPPGWPVYDLESILMIDPGWILSSARNASLLDGLKERPGWKELAAVRRGRLVAVDPAIERPSPRVIDAMELLRELMEARAKK